jgi:hypothetical protein
MHGEGEEEFFSYQLIHTTSKQKRKAQSDIELRGG